MTSFNTYRHNNGHVTKIQASQCLHTLGLTDDPEEIKVMKETAQLHKRIKKMPKYSLLNIGIQLQSRESTAQ